MKEMTSRERVIAAIERTGPDRVPMDFGGTMLSACLPEFLVELRKELGFTLPDDRDEDGRWVDEQIQEYFNVDLRYVPGVPTLKYLKEADPEEYVRQRALLDAKIQSEKDGTTHAVRTVFPLEDMELEEVQEYYKTHSEYDPTSDRNIQWCIDVAKEYRRKGYATTFWLSGGPFERGCWLRGYDQFCMDLIIEPEIVEEICSNIVKGELERINKIVPLLAPYIDIFCFGDDLATQKAPFMSPDMYKEMLMPYHKEVYQRVIELAPESYVFHHCCGSSFTLLPSLREAGVTVSNPTQITAEGMHVENLATVDKICFHGGIDLQEVLSHYTPDQVLEETNRVIKALSHDGAGGYICAPCHSLPEDVPVANILAMFKADRSLK